MKNEPAVPSRVRIERVSGANMIREVAADVSENDSDWSIPSPVSVTWSPQGMRETEKSKASDSRKMLSLKEVV